MKRRYFLPNPAADIRTVAAYVNSFQDNPAVRSLSFGREWNYFQTAPISDVCYADVEEDDPAVAIR